MGAIGTVGEGVAEQLVPGADPEDHRTPVHRFVERPVGHQRLGRPDLGPVLAPAEAVDVGRRERCARVGLQESGIDAPPRCPPGQDQPVPAVPVGAEQVGIDDGDGQGRPARRVRSGARRHTRSRRSAKAV